VLTVTLVVPLINRWVRRTKVVLLRCSRERISARNSKTSLLWLWAMNLLLILNSRAKALHLIRKWVVQSFKTIKKIRSLKSKKTTKEKKVLKVKLKALSQKQQKKSAKQEIQWHFRYKSTEIDRDTKQQSKNPGRITSQTKTTKTLGTLYQANSILRDCKSKPLAVQLESCRTIL